MSVSRRVVVVVLSVLAAPAFAAPASAQVDYGDLALQPGMVPFVALPRHMVVELQVGLKADVAGMEQAATAASDPASPTYGHYLSLRELAARYGAPAAARRVVTRALRRRGARVIVDATHQQLRVRIPLRRAQRLFHTRWRQYLTPPALQTVALPVRAPRLSKGIARHVDAVAGLRVLLPSLASAAHARTAQAGAPQRTGTPDAGCLGAAPPSASGLYPNQILTAYGIAPLQAGGLRGHGVRVAILGTGPVPRPDLARFRACFGSGGTRLRMHSKAGLAANVESSLDTMIVSMVAPRLAGFDLWARQLADGSDPAKPRLDLVATRDVIAAPLQAAAHGGRLPDVVSVSFGTCEPYLTPFSASRTLIERELAAYASLGITVVVASGDAGSTDCAHANPSDHQVAVNWPGSSPWVLAVGGTTLTLDAGNHIAATGAWNQAAYPSPCTANAAGGGGVSQVAAKPSWQPGAGPMRQVPDVSVFADSCVGYPIFCSPAAVGCPPSSVAYPGGTSAGAPLVAGMIALWTQDALRRGLTRPGFIPPLLYALAPGHPQALLDVTQGTISVFGDPCCAAGPGYDQATGLGSPIADQVAALLKP